MVPNADVVVQPLTQRDVGFAEMGPAAAQPSI